MLKVRKEIVISTILSGPNIPLNNLVSSQVQFPAVRLRITNVRCWPSNTLETISLLIHLLHLLTQAFSPSLLLAFLTWLGPDAEEEEEEKGDAGEEEEGEEEEVKKK